MRRTGLSADHLADDLAHDIDRWRSEEEIFRGASEARIAEAEPLQSTPSPPHYASTVTDVTPKQKPPFDEAAAHKLLIYHKIEKTWTVTPSIDACQAMVSKSFDRAPRAAIRRLHKKLWPGTRPGPRPKSKRKTAQ
jgi:hypothetical protein